MHTAAPGTHLVFLPATEPDDRTFGTIPTRIRGRDHVRAHQVRFRTMVWYSRPVRDDAIGQILALGVSPIVLIGFSKSGLGAWNIAMELPQRVAATVIFDAPVAAETSQPWNLSPFYRDREEFLADLPIRRVAEYARVMPAAHPLVLVAGEQFHDQMGRLSAVLREAGIAHEFLARPGMKHHWRSGWIEEALDRALGRPGPAAHGRRPSALRSHCL